MSDKKDSAPDEDNRPAWLKALASPERIAALEAGKITLRQYHALSSDDMERFLDIGFRFYEQGKYNEARSIFSGLIALDPWIGYSYVALGVVFLAEENMEKAREHFDLAISVNPKEMTAYLNRGELSLREGNLADAEKDLKQAFALHSNPQDVFAQRASILLNAIQQIKDGAAKKSQPQPAGSAKNPKSAAAPKTAPASKEKSAPKSKGGPAPKSKK